MPDTQVVANVLPVFEGGKIADAFHGTTSSCAAAIMERRGFKPGMEGMYGEGVYFFEGDYWAASWWARKRQREQHSGSAVVIRAEVSLGKVLYANLMVPEVQRLKPEMERVLGQPISEDKAWQLLTAALLRNGLISSIRVTREADKRWLPPDSEYRFEIVICACDPSKITIVQQLKPEDLNKTIAVAVL